MGDLISREDTLAEIKRIYCTGCNDYRGVRCRACEISDVMDVVDDMPAVDAEPVRRGEWMHLGGDEWCCNTCGDVIHTEGSWEKPTKKYCSECGAKMKEEEESDPKRKA